MRKRDVWREVASQMIAAGFNFRNKETAWEKVSQKWRNMERSYRMHVNLIRTKGQNDSTRTMEFFDDLHELLACKYNTESVVSDSTNDVSYPSHSDADESQIYEMMNGNMDYDEEEQEESIVTAEPGPDLPQPEVCYDTYVEDELPPSPTFSDNKNLVFASYSETPEVQDPVVRLLLEMRAQERAHFREDRRERLKMQRETLDFRRDLVDLLNQHHQERMEVMHSLISAISGALGTNATSSSRTNEKLRLPNGDHSNEDVPLNSSRQNNHLS